MMHTPLLAPKGFLADLRYFRSVYASKEKKKPTWIGDYFIWKDGGIFIPITHETATHINSKVNPYVNEAELFHLAYDYEKAKTVTFYNPKADYHVPLDDQFFRLGSEAFIANPLRSHLLYLRLDGDLNAKKTQQNTLYLNKLTAQGFDLPHVINGGAVYQAPDGSIGEALLVREKDTWKAYFTHGGSLPFPRGVYHERWSINPDLEYIHFGAIACNRLLGYHSDLVYPRLGEPANAAVTGLLFRHNFAEAVTSFNRRVNYSYPPFIMNKAFSLSAVLHSPSATKGMPGLVFKERDNGKNKNRPDYPQHFLVPITSTTDENGIQHVTLHPEETRRVSYFSDDTLDTSTPAELPGPVRPLIKELCLFNKPTLTYPLTLQLG